MIIKNEENASPKPLTPAMEDYLEAIFDLDKEKKVVRVRDIAKQLGVKMPTVTSMLKSLRDRNLVNYQKYEYVELTREGESVGKEINRRHHILRRFLTEVLKVRPALADEEACKMEHAICQTTLDKLVNFMEFIQACPRTGAEWLERFDEFCVHGLSPEKCQKETSAFTEELRLRTGESEEPNES
jgi:DtxR family Mn-dependent transcriptional regulator